MYLEKLEPVLESPHDALILYVLMSLELCEGGFQTP